MDVYDYFDQKVAEFRSLSLTPDRGYADLFAELEGSNGQRGRIFGNVNLDSEMDAFISISERIEVKRKYLRRVECGYFLVVEGAEIWGYELDLSHDPAIHRHTADHGRRIAESKEVSFRWVAEKAWDDVTRLITTS